MKRAAMIFLLCCLAALPVFAAGPLPDPQQEARAIAIGAELRCVVCQSESINDSQADLARDLRKLVRQKIAAGWSDERIITYVRSRYGDFVLLRPPVQPNTYLLWLAPVFIFTTATGAAALFIRRGRKKP